MATEKILWILNDIRELFVPFFLLRQNNDIVYVRKYPSS